MKIITIILPFLLLFSISCSGAPDEELLLSLDGFWEYRTGFKKSWLIPSEYRKEEWKRINIPLNFKDEELKKDADIITFRWELPDQINEKFDKNKVISFKSHLIADMTAEFYFNGAFLKSLGSTDPLDSAFLASYIGELPGSVWKKGESNAIYMVVNRKSYFEENQRIDRNRAVIGLNKQVYRTHFRQIAVPLIFLSIFIMIGLHHLIIFTRRKKDIENLYFALTCIFAALYTFFASINKIDYNLSMQLFGSNASLLRLAMTSIFMASVFFMLFSSYYNYKRHLKLYIVFAAYCVLISIIEMTAPISWLPAVVVSWYLFIFIMIIHASYATIRRALQGHKDSIILMGVGVILIAGVFYDILLTVLKFEGEPVTHIAFFLFIIGITVVLADRFARVYNELEILNISLEEKVKARTEELQSAMEELEAVNENLTAVNREIEEANRRYRIDMDMAQSVQAAFLPPGPPDSEQFDIALLYKPMSGASGDFYDFFYDGGEIEGVGIFDVSGHGISSGLLTLLAKSIISGNFSEMKTEKLGAVMSSINNSLIEEIGESGFYLTGALIRFSEDDIEYVNASHPPIIFKSGKTGHVSRVPPPENRDFSGHLLGISMIQEKYNTIRVKFRDGDTILLYTDPLYETKNNDGKEFDFEGIINSVKNAPDGSAQDILGHIMKSFYDHTGNKETINDDMTVIVIRKK